MEKGGGGAEEGDEDCEGELGEDQEEEAEAQVEPGEEKNQEGEGEPEDAEEVGGGVFDLAGFPVEGEEGAEDEGVEDDGEVGHGGKLKT